MNLSALDIDKGWRARDAAVTGRTVMRYVNGFMMNPVTRHVLLIQKNRPAFQAGKWNGIGGKIEPGESPIEAMCREFWEEAGVITTAHDWQPTVVLQGRSFVVHFYRSLVSDFPDYRTVTDEVVRLCSIDDVYAVDHIAVDEHGKVSTAYTLPSLDNMKWILPLQLQTQIKFPVVVEWVDATAPKC